MIDNSQEGSTGSVEIQFVAGENPQIPTNCDKIYCYITLGSTASANIWGVYHTWDSSEEGSRILEYEEEE